MKKVLIITSKLVQDHEFIYPFFIDLKKKNLKSLLSNLETKQTLGYFGTKIPPKEEDKIILPNEIKVDDYDLLVLPGGVKSMENSKTQYETIIKIIKEFNVKKKIISATCSANNVINISKNN